MNKKRKRKYGIVFCLVSIVMLVIGNVLSRIDFARVNAFSQKFTGILDIIEIIISFTSVFSIVLLYRQIKAEHEKSRREKTVDLLVQWSLQLKPETNMAVKIVEKLKKKYIKILEVYLVMISVKKEKEKIDAVKLNYQKKKLRSYVFW